MRVSVTADSATPDEVYRLTLALQRTAGITRPTGLATDPTVRAAGSAMTWTSPPLYSDGAAALLREYHALTEQADAS